MNTLKKIIKQGDCGGIICSDCYFYLLKKDTYSNSWCKIGVLGIDISIGKWCEFKVKIAKKELNKIRENKLKRIL